MQRREGTYLSFLAFAFGMKRSSCHPLSRSFNVELSTFFKPCVSHLFEALCYSSLGALLFEALCYSSLGALLSSGDGVSGKLGEGGR